MLGLQRLEERRMRSDLIETFKIVNRKYDINPEFFFQLGDGDRRGHDQKLFKKRFRLNVRKYVFSNRERPIRVNRPMSNVPIFRRKNSDVRF